LVRVTKKRQKSLSDECHFFSVVAQKLQLLRIVYRSFALPAIRRKRRSKRSTGCARPSGRSIRTCQSTIGIIPGLIAALAVMRLLEGFLYEVDAHDPLTFVAIILLLAGTSLLACYIPARRAARVDPIRALRYD
jgi:hypothetical protein